MDPHDQADVAELLGTVAAVDGEPALSEQKRIEFDAGPAGASTGARSLARLTDSGRLVGYGHLSRGNDSWGIEIAVHPDHREGAEAESLGSVLLASLLDEISTQGGGQAYFWAPRAGAVHDRIATANGLQPGRELIQMQVPLPLAPAPGDQADALVTRAFRPGQDEAAWLAVNNRAFASHPEQGGWSIDELRRREQEEWFDPAGLLLHEVDGRLAGSCWTKIHRDLDPPQGEIYVISVDPDFQGRGLGRSLTTAGLSWLSGRGITVGMLYVDGDNVAAVKLYRSMGFTDDHVDRAYTGMITARA
ncbi:MAG TPA: mycothiol synthase [Acidimicrobiales bacterium]|nr:mycothiol synthase [Acidimicrobiales bacterium]